MAKRSKDTPVGRPGAMTRHDADAKRRRREGKRATETTPRDAGPSGVPATEARGKSDVAPPPSADAPPSAKASAASAASPRTSSRAARQIVASMDPNATEADEAPEDDGHETHHLDGAAWGRPFAKLDAMWTWFETRMLFVTLITLITLLCTWIGLRGMQDRNSIAGIFFRALFGMGALGAVARYATKKLALNDTQRTWVTLLAIAAGAGLAKSWAHFGNDYFQGALDWLQQGSSISLFGGLRGISTRLTMLVALIGGSLACASGTHINVDVIVRFAPKNMRKIAHVVAMLGASLVCLSASYGFFDFIAISGFHAATEAPMSAKFAAVGKELGGDFFVLRKQLSLDAGALPFVVQGKRWNSDERMNGREWNEFVDEGGFVERYGAEATAGIKATAADLDKPRRPFVIVPGGSAAGSLLEGLNLVFPIGFLMLGLRLLLRVVLVLAGFLEPHLEGEGSGAEEEPEPGAPTHAEEPA